jgi:cytoskeleton protein RodZ
MEPMTEGTGSQPATAGAWLKSVRQQRGLHIAALAVTLKVPQAKLEALEADRYDQLPDATFARALATAMCRALKVDAAPVLALLPRTRDREFDVRPGLNQPFRERGSSPMDGSALALLARPVVWGPALLLLAAAIVYWMPTGWLERPETQATPVAVFPPAASAPVAASSAPLVEFVPAPAAQPAPEPVASAPVVAAAVASSPAPQPAAVTPVQASPAPVAAAPAGQSLRISATAETWVEVVDAQGQMLLSRLLRDGEQQVLGGTAPYKVRIGNVAGTRIEWRGAAVDLAGRSKDNVARLELN